MTNLITFNKVPTVYFQVLVNGVLQENIYIYNSCAGESGNGRNVYGIAQPNEDKFQIVGSLQKCKNMVSFWLK